MPPSAVKTVQDLIYWQYAKIISESAKAGKRSYAFVMNRFKKLQSGEIEWSRGGPDIPDNVVMACKS